MVEGIYHRFNKERLYDQVADYVEGLIHDGKLQTGDQLPPERELTERLGVARGVIREAMKVLVARGLVLVEPGRGTFVAEMGADSLSDHLGRFLKFGKQSHDDLNELRRVLEVEIAFLSAQRATVEDLEAMRQAIEEMDSSLAISAEAYIAADQAFHVALARGTKNDMFPLLINVIADLLQESRRVIFQVPGAPERGQSWHRCIYAAVERHDARAAREAMWHHMEQVSADKEAYEVENLDMTRSDGIKS